MTTASELHSLRAVLQAQRHVLEQASGRLDALAPALGEANGQADQLRVLSGLMDEIEQESRLLCAADMVDWNPGEIESIYQRRQEAVVRETSALAFVDWNQFVRDSVAYCAEHDLECSLPWEAFLSNEDLQRLQEEEYGRQYRWDKWDYTFVGAAGVLASLTDFFLVAIPKTMTSGVFEGQKGSIVTEWLDKLKLPPALQKWLEAVSKVPYDNTGGGDHRIDTFGHDPVLGFIIGVIDIMRGGATTIKGGVPHIESGIADPEKNPVVALLRQFLHMASDATTSRGLPVPFASVFRLMNFGSFTGPGGKTRTINDLVLWMYHHGYDLRHFITMGITPCTIEIVLRAYLMIRHYVERGEVAFALAGNPKYRSMLLSAHAVACAANVGKVAVYQGNPLAINYAEWLALMRYLLPSLKYWLFDRSRLRLEHMDRIANEGWVELTAAGDTLLKRSYAETLEVVSLGRRE